MQLAGFLAVLAGAIFAGKVAGILLPFLLKTIVELTGGDSLESNIELVLNNAKVGAQIARSLCKK